MRRHRRSTAVHPHLHSNHYSGLFVAFSFFFFHYSSALFPEKRSARLSHQLQTAPFARRCHATSLSSLCHIQPLKCHFTAAVASLCHIVLFSASRPLGRHIFMHPLISHLSLHECCCLSFCLSLSIFRSLCYSLSLFGLQAEAVLDSQRRSTGLNDRLVNGVTDNSAN